MNERRRLSELPATTDAARIAARFAPEIELCEELLAAVWHDRPPRHAARDEFQAVLLSILSRSLEVFDAALALIHTGRSLSALMLNRALFEDMIAAFWLALPSDRPARLRRIQDQEDHIVLLTNEVIRDYQHRLLVAPEEHEDLEAKRAELTKTFGRYGSKTWFGDLHPAIREVAPIWEELGGSEETLRVYYAIVQRHINLHIHNTVSSIKRSMSRYDDPRSIDDEEIGLALRASFFNVHGLAQLVFRELGVDRAGLWELERRSHLVFVELTPKKRSQLGRNDPCWCGSGKKLKHCHGS